MAHARDSRSKRRTFRALSTIALLLGGVLAACSRDSDEGSNDSGRDTEASVGLPVKLVSSSGRFEMSLPTGFTPLDLEAATPEEMLGGLEVDDAGKLAVETVQKNLNPTDRTVPDSVKFTAAAIEFNVGDPVNDNVNVVERTIAEGNDRDDIIKILNDGFLASQAQVVELEKRDDYSWPAIYAEVRVPVEGKYLATSYQMIYFGSEYSYETTVTIGDDDSSATIDALPDMFESVQLSR